MKYERRATLHKNSKEAFAEWLESNGWSIEELKGCCEALRAKKDGRWFIAYDRSRGDHFTVQDNMMDVVAEFLKFKKKVKL